MASNPAIASRLQANALVGRVAELGSLGLQFMSRSFHVTERQRKRDKAFNRDNSGKRPTELSKLDVLSLKKLTAKWSEKWKRDAAKAGGLTHTKFVFVEDNPQKRTIKQKCRGRISDFPGEVIEKKKDEASRETRSANS